MLVRSAGDRVSSLFRDFCLGPSPVPLSPSPLLSPFLSALFLFSSLTQFPPPPAPPPSTISTPHRLSLSTSPAFRPAAYILLLYVLLLALTNPCPTPPLHPLHPRVHPLSGSLGLSLPLPSRGLALLAPESLKLLSHLLYRVVPYICMYVCIQLCMYMYMYICIHLCMYIRVCLRFLLTRKFPSVIPPPRRPPHLFSIAFSPDPRDLPRVRRHRASVRLDKALLRSPPPPPPGLGFSAASLVVAETLSRACTRMPFQPPDLERNVHTGDVCVRDVAGQQTGSVYLAFRA